MENGKTEIIHEPIRKESVNNLTLFEKMLILGKRKESRDTIPGITIIN